MHGQITALLILTTSLLATAQQGKLVDSPQCNNGSWQWVASSCNSACGGFSGHVPDDHESHTVAGCTATLTRRDSNIAGRIVSDSCGQLLTACGQVNNAVSNFASSFGSNGQGTIKITYDPAAAMASKKTRSEDTAPAPEIAPRMNPNGAITNCTAGSYTLVKANCSDAAQQAIPPPAGVTQGGYTKTVGSCTVNYRGSDGNSMSKSALATGALDILEDPNCCNAQGFCTDQAKGEVIAPSGGFAFDVYFTSDTGVSGFVG